MKNRFSEIKKHFEKEAKIFDKLFYKIIPHYEFMLDMLTEAVPFNKKSKLKIIDLGCGTGNLSKKIISAYPKSHLTCLDMSENMIKMAKTKFAKFPSTIFWLGDIRKFHYSKKYDAVISSMALHHIEGDEKISFYRRLFKILKKGGVFLNFDIFIAHDKYLQEMYTDQWCLFMKKKGLSKSKIKEMLARHKKEDRPIFLENELSILHKAGFKKVDIIFKNFNFAVYGARK